MIRLEPKALDLIGDVHGHATQLHALLIKLGYRRSRGAHRHPEGRIAVFVGDLIDRGPEQVETIRLVQDMTETSSALCVMGNHEWNAIGYATPSQKRPRHFLHRRSANVVFQHSEFLKQVGEGSGVHRAALAFFKTLPPFLDLGGVRVVHAWWHQPYVDLIEQHLYKGSWMTDEFLETAFTPKTPECQAMKGLLTGLNVKLPEGARFFDDFGHPRDRLRLKWWSQDRRHYRDVLMPPSGLWVNPEKLDREVPLDQWPGQGDPQPKPVFLGHYWMKGDPAALTPTVACLDYSVARGGPLVAYRWDGEATIQNDRFVFV